MKNFIKKINNDKGITLVALVVTIIVLLILAGVSLSAVFSEKGIFSRAEKAGNKYNEAKARETLETVLLADAQYEKHSNPKYDQDDFLDELITKGIEGAEVIDDTVIVGGYMYELDRSVPKIGKYLGIADGVIITAKISGNNGWKGPENAKVIITGKILTYSGGRITDISATKGSQVISGFGINQSDGSYTIEVTEDTTVKINAEDSNGKKAEKIIPITIKIDSTPPTVDSIDARAEGLKIIFTATGNDKNSEGQEESGIKHFNYTITSTEDKTLEGIPADKRKGSFASGNSVDIMTTPTGNREETKYTITVTATDNCDNITPTSGAKTANVTAIDGITVEQAKKLVNENTLQQYIGKRVTDYIPEAGGKWRVFYYDKNGEFGENGTVYLMRDASDNLTFCRDPYVSVPISDNGVNIMKQMNPMWAKSQNHNKIDKKNEEMVVWLCDSENFLKYKTDDSSFVIGSPSIEMFAKAYNIYKENTYEGTSIIYKLDNTSDRLGYVPGISNTYPSTSGTDNSCGPIDKGPSSIFYCLDCFLSSPCAWCNGTSNTGPVLVQNGYFYNPGTHTTTSMIRPVSALKK